MTEEQPKVYFRRHLVLFAYFINYFIWMLSNLRYTAIVPSYALYHDTTNEVSAPPRYGIDSFTLVTSITMLISYFFGGYVVDRFGIKSMTLGSFMLTLGSWGWYFSGKNILLVLLSRAFKAFFAPVITSCLLAISNRWFPANERGKATAIGALSTVLGAACALIVAPAFKTNKEEFVELSLRSCKKESLSLDIVNAFAASKSNGTQLTCTGPYLDAKDNFCCYLPVDVRRLNLVMAIASTAVSIATIFLIKDRPPTPPALSAEKKEYLGFFDGLKRIFSDERFVKLSCSDFLISGPPVVVYVGISRIFPAEISKYATLCAAIGLAVAIPVSVIAGHIMDKKKWFWSAVMTGYVFGTAAWIIATICLATRSSIGYYIFLFIITSTLCANIAWQTAVFETKIEYGFSPQVEIEGVIVATDRIILNLSTIIFVASIVPERVGGINNTFYIGLGIMILGCIPAAIISNKFKYSRLEYDSQKN